jgi:Ca-activated chloride channel homolog
MTWRDPMVLWTLLAVPAAVLLFWWAARRRRAALAALGDAALVERLVHERLRDAYHIVLPAILLLIALALAGPRLGAVETEVADAGLDLVIALDVSNSMLAEDIAPSRLERARLEIGRLADAVPGYRLGLVVFAGDAFVLCPLTTDHGAFRLFLDAASPEMLSAQGTDFPVLLAIASSAFPDDDLAAQRGRALLIVSDGENHAGSFAPELAALRNAGVSLLAAGIGGPEPVPIPIRVQGEVRGFRTAPDGSTARTRLEERVLSGITSDYIRLQGSASLSDLRPALARLERRGAQSVRFAVHAERFQWPLALALALLAGSRLLAPAARSRKEVSA